MRKWLKKVIDGIKPGCTNTLLSIYIQFRHYREALEGIFQDIKIFDQKKYDVLFIDSFIQPANIHKALSMERKTDFWAQGQYMWEGSA